MISDIDQMMDEYDAILLKAEKSMDDYTRLAAIEREMVRKFGPDYEWRDEDHL